ncbi:hypothetical protein HA520_14025 [Azotobacter chroococcum]|uniref:Uncharacterized protein n=1 Tax=Azotobacter chroococcum TaxID=353 RepID=A0AA43Z983_9GAMM|nr:hypothetical protein [Azotobacter chroococcum]NHN78383.1 hypothetical protein [Azotobacter chroococcum]
MHEEFDAVDPSGLRLCNTISLLVPAQTYHINCGWTKEISLPVVEEYTCRLLLALQEVLPGDIQEYFGLSKREAEVLVDTLVHNKLAVYSNDGHLAPSPMLLDRTKGNPNVAASLTKYEECIEDPVIELLTLSVMPKSRYSSSRFGLYEIPIPLVHKSIGTNQIAETFGSQYRAYLDTTRQQDRESKRKRLYKVGACEMGKPVQIPVDIDIWLLPSSAGDVQVIKRASERVGDIRQRPLSIELESRISDYLSEMKLPTGGMSLSEFCRVFDDTVLLRYVDERGLDSNRWLRDHHHRKTGYNDSQTRAMIGPVYAHNNRLTITRILQELAKDWEDGATHNALWLSSSVPLWAANGALLTEFCAKVAIHLSEERNTHGKITALLPADDRNDIHRLRRIYHARIPNGLGFKGQDLQDKVEVFLIPSQLAVVQYHFQPSQESAVTVPIGYLTHDPERLKKIESFLDSRLQDRGNPEVLWTQKEGNDVENLLGASRMEALYIEVSSREAAHKPRVIIKKPRTW